MKDEEREKTRKRLRQIQEIYSGKYITVRKTSLWIFFGSSVATNMLLNYLVSLIN